MNLNVEVEDSLAEKLDRLSRQQSKERNTIIKEALEAWIAQHTTSSWSEVVLTYEGEENGVVFEAYRDELLVPVETEL